MHTSCRKFAAWIVFGLVGIAVLQGGLLAQDADLSAKKEDEAVVASETAVENEAVAEGAIKPGAASPTDVATETTGESDVEILLAGHSYHGEAFNEGPRQQAYLMGGTGKVDFQVTTSSTEAQAFINQGVGQIHGFWDLEAERSFRQAAALDSNCAMAYWGAALASYRDRKRAKGFMKKALDLRDKVSDREQMYIDALANYFEVKKGEDENEDSKAEEGSGTSDTDDAEEKKETEEEKEAKKERAADYLKALESIALKYPDDLEAKALICHRIWQNGREGIPVSSYLATDALLNQIFDEQPLHPAHHYSIHLWDYRQPERAIDAAARCGVAAPSIAHMWHMPGHIYSRLKRYEDAVYQQEASARVDHAHMMRDRVMPDEIANFAHNNEWLIRNLTFIGRAKDTVDLAENMISLPKHPKYNTLEKSRGSYSYGRRRLLSVLREFQMYDLAVEKCLSNVLGEVAEPEEHVKTMRLLGCSAAMTSRIEEFEYAKAQLESRLQDNEQDLECLTQRMKKLKLALDKSDDLPPRPCDPTVDVNDAEVELAANKKDQGKCKKLIKASEKALLALEGYRLAAGLQFAEAEKKLRKANGEDVSWLAELKFRGGDVEGGLKEVKDQVKRRPKEVIPLARQTYLEYLAGDKQAAMKTFAILRDTSSSMDLDLEMFSRLAPIAKLCGATDSEGNWLKPIALAADTGFRPSLDSLGPFRWTPSDAPEWQLFDANDSVVSSRDFAGQAHLMIFYLGNGCLHCAEQLQAFAPRAADFEEAGIELIAVSTDGQEELKQDIQTYTGEMEIRWMVSDAAFEVFKKFRAHDDFEGQPLHGTFLVDGQGKIRWQDISYEPFMDHQFLLDEAERLLRLHEPKKLPPKASEVSQK